MSVKIGASVKGLREIARNMGKTIEQADGAIGAAIYEEALDIDAKAVGQMPVDTGRMRASHYVTPPQDSPRRE